MADNLTKPYVFANAFCNSGDKTGNIPVADTNTNSASLAKGFPVVTSTAIAEGGIPPKRTDFNGILNALSQYCCFLQNGGEFEFDSSVSTAIGGYSDKAVLKYIDTNSGGIYKIKSLINNNTNAPSSSNIRVSSSQTGTFYWELVNNGIPTGAIMPFTGAVVPNGYLLADGTEVSKTTYAFLYALIGDTYGTPEDNTKFKLPDFRNKTFWGGNTTNVGTEKESALPNITGTFWSVADFVWNSFNSTGAFVQGSNQTRQDSGTASSHSYPTIKFDASKSSNVYKDGQTIVQPPAIQVPFIIKF